MALLFSEDGRGGEGGGMVGGYASGGRTNVCTCGADRVTGNRHACMHVGIVEFGKDCFGCGFLYFWGTWYMGTWVHSVV